VRHWAKRIGGWLATPSGLTGGFLGAATVAAQPGANGIPGLVLGWLYGVVVGGLLRLFRVPPGAYPLTGFLAGPVPIALLMPAGAPTTDRGVIWLGFLAGLLIGLVEWAHALRPQARPGAGAEPPPDP
jgi:hypothetical protein